MIVVIYSCIVQFYLVFVDAATVISIVDIWHCVAAFAPTSKWML